MPPALGDSSGMGVRVSRGLLKLEVQVETWWMWCGVSGGPHSGFCVIAGGPSVSALAPGVPPKFWQPHVAVCFGAAGQLVLVCPHQPAEGQPAYVELHSLEVQHSPAPQTTLSPPAGAALRFGTQQPS